MKLAALLRALCMAATAATALVALPARATAEWALQGGSTFYRVSNPFLFPGNSNDYRNSADTAYSTDLRAALFMPLPTDRSHLALTGSISKMQYGNTFANLDYYKKQYIGLYEWEYSTFLRGKLSTRSDQRLYSYFGGNLTNLEVPHLKENLVEVALRILPKLDVPVTLSNQSLRYIDPSRTQLYNMDSDIAQVALRYESGIKSILQAGVKQSRVNFPDRSAADIAAIDSGYTDRELFLDTNWRYTENTILRGHVGSVQRRFATLPGRDSNIASYELGVDWQYSLISTLGLRFYDRPQPNDEADSRLYSISRAVQARGTWQATPKIRVLLQSSLETQRYENFANLGNNVVGNGNDKLVRLGARVDYDITPRLALRAEAYSEKTLSGGNASEYRRNILQIGLHYTFENMVGHNRARAQIDDLQSVLNNND